MLEAEITGGLEHPGIVPVYGLGTYADGRPFYAMRFIRGDSLKEAIERFHKKSSADFADYADKKQSAALKSAKSAKSADDFFSLEFRQLLGRFVDVCNAIAYAHSRGVLHRDLKPGNIMLGKYGETLVVDWGLAKAVGRRQSAGGSPKPGEPGASATGVSGSPLPSGGEGPGVRGQTPLDEPPLTPSGSDFAQTVAGTALGTPAFMSPEQAAGRLDLLGPAADIYSLGATLYAVLTNRPPVAGKDTAEILHKVQIGDIDWPRRIGFQPVPPPLIAICQKAMALHPADRYATPLALAEDIEHWLADEPVSAYREPWTKRLGRWRRRHNTFVTATTLVLITLMVGGIVAFGVVERQTAQARALAQVDALQDAAAGAVPALLAELAADNVAAFARTRARERWADPALTDRQRLRIGLALAADDADVRKRLVELAQKADDPQEVLLVRDALKTPEVAATSGVLTADLWKRSQDASLPRVERLRLWAILATLDPDGPGWQDAVEPAVNEVFAANPLHLGVWQQALAPVRQTLLPVLQKAYRDPAAERRQLAAALLADYAADQPEVLADLVLEADAKQFGVVFAAAASLEKEKNKSGVTAPHSKWVAELDKKPAPPQAGKEIFKKEGTIAADDAPLKVAGRQSMPAKLFEVVLQAGTAYKISMTSKEIDSFLVVQDSAGKELGFDDDSGGGLNSLLEFTAPRTETYKVYAAALENKDAKSAGAFVLTITEAAAANVAGSGPLAGSNLASRQANAAVALLRLSAGQVGNLSYVDKVWPLLKHAPDPSVRSYLVHRLGPQGVDLAVVLKRFEEEKDTSTRRALLLSIGEYSPVGQIPPQAQFLVPKLLDLYRTDADAGLHAAAAWLLTHWGEKEKLLAIDRQLAATEPPIKNPTWWVNSQGQTMIALPGPIEFLMGASASDPDHGFDEVQHLRRINRSFALAAHPVTVEQFLKFRKSYTTVYLKKHAPTSDCPAHGTDWFDAAGYCNWLSEQEKIAKDQWCYETNVAGKVVKLKENYLSLTGYRLPTEAEMEYGCRAKAVTRCYYGDQEELLDRYAWLLKNGQDRSWPVGLLKPNDFGFFDMHGNVWNWCQEKYQLYPQAKDGKVIEDNEDSLSINNQDSRVLRGGSFGNRAGNVRSSNRSRGAPTVRIIDTGFRPSRTLPLDFFTALPATP